MRPFSSHSRVASDARDVAWDICEPVSEDVAFVLWYPQRFLDGISEAVACESEVFEHGW